MFDNKQRRHLTLAALLVLASVQRTAWADRTKTRRKMDRQRVQADPDPEQQLEE
jgi:glycerol transport system substrate-binding protein